MTVTNGYATLSELKAYVGIGTADTSIDLQLETALNSASRLIDADCDRVFYASGTAVQKFYTPSDWRTVDIDDAITITEVATDDSLDGTYSTVWAPSSYQVTPINRSAGGSYWPATGIRALARAGSPNAFIRNYDEATVRVTGQWGFGTAVPDDVHSACLLQASRLWKRADAPFAVAGFGEMGAVRVTRTDPDVYALISRYKKSKVSVA